MAKLSKKRRENISSKLFGVPSKAPGPGSYPMPDKKHAKIAEGLAAMHHDPREAQIDAKARRLYPDLKLPSGRKRR